MYIWQRMAVSAEHRAGGGTACSAHHASLFLAGLSLPASSPAGTATLSPTGRARHPHGGTSGLPPDDFSPFSHTSPPSLASPRPQLQSLCPELCLEAGKGSGQPVSPSQLLMQGFPPSAIPAGKPVHRSPPGEQDEGSSCSNPNSAGCAQRAVCELPVQSLWSA